MSLAAKPLTPEVTKRRFKKKWGSCREREDGRGGRWKRERVRRYENVGDGMTRRDGLLVVDLINQRP